MKKAIALILTLCIVFTLCACGGSDPAPAPADPATPATPADPATPEAPEVEDLEPVTLSYSTHVGAEGVNNHNMVLLQEKVNAILGGEYLTIEIYPSNTLGTGATMLDDIRSGVTDIGNVMVSNNTSVLPMCALFQTPGGGAFLSSRSASHAFKEYLETIQPAELEGLVVLTYLASGPGSIVTKFEAHTMEDLSGHMIRSSATTAASITAWGATPVTLDWSECYEGMRNNLIDGIYTNTGAPADNNFDDVVDYHIVAPWYNECELFAMNKDVFDSLPAAMQDAIKQASEEIFLEYTSRTMDVAENPFPMFKRYFAAIDGVIFFSDEEVAKMNDAISGIAGEAAAALDDQGLNGTEALKLIGELADKYNAQYDGSENKTALLEMGAVVID